MIHRLLLVGLLVSPFVRVTVSAPAPKDPVRVLRDNNLTLWEDVLKLAGVNTAVNHPTARYAAFVPTDAAVRSFLQQMGLTMQGLAARPVLAKHLVAQHLVLALNPEAQKDLLDGKLTTLQTAAAVPGNNVTQVSVLLGPVAATSAQPTQRQLLVTDPQGRTAKSVNIIPLDANKVAVILDSVLMSGRYYSNFASLCQQRGKAAAPMCEALVKSRVVPNLGSNSFANTLFFSGAAAFTRAQVQPSSVEPAALARLVKNSIVPGLHAFPDGFVSGNSYPTLLEGARLKIVYEKLPGTPNPVQYEDLRAFVIPADQQRVEVVVYNVFVGQGIAQGIPVLLLPPGWAQSSQVASQASTAPARQSGSAQQAQGAGGGSSKSGSQSTGGRRRLTGGFPEAPKVTMPLNAAETQIRDTVRGRFREDESRWG